MINYYILAAGDGTRFLNAGYETPKHLLPIGDSTVIGQIVSRMPINAKLTVIAKQEHRKATVEAVRHDNAQFIWLPNRGGIIADLSNCTFPDDGEIIINYCDCWLDGVDRFAEKCRNADVDAGVVVFSSDDPRHDRVIRGVAYGGVYWFKNAAILRDAIEQSKLDDGVLLAVKRTRDYIIYDSYNYVDVGVPEDYEKWKSQMSK